MEANSLATVRMHLDHFDKTLGQRFPVLQHTLADLQRHIAARSRKPYPGQTLSTVTRKKGVASFGAASNWAALTGLMTSLFPSRGLLYPTAEEKSPFRTWQKIERCIQVGELTADQVDELWQCLYLRNEEVAQLTSADAGWGW
jgi:hypothetical protein